MLLRVADGQAEAPLLLDHSVAQLEGTFIQYRILAGLTTPLRSEVFFKFHQEGHLTWRVSKPVASRLEVYRDRIEQADGDAMITQLSAEKNPLVQVLINIFFGLIENDRASLATHFVVSSQTVNSTWHDHLVPKDKHFGQAIEWIEIEGRGKLERLVMQERNGDQLRIEFHHETGR